MITRPAVPADAEGIAQVVAEGFAGFASFSPPGWSPAERATPENVAAIRDRLWAPRAWASVAEDGGRLVGICSFEPAKDGTPDAAYLIHCFVRQAYWGTGLAAALLAEAVEAATAAGYREMRLVTPALQARARRFYAREGWVEQGSPVFEPRLSMDIVRLSRRLDGNRRRPTD